MVSTFCINPLSYKIRSRILLDCLIRCDTRILSVYEVNIRHCIQQCKHSIQYCSVIAVGVVNPDSTNLRSPLGVLSTNGDQLQLARDTTPRGGVENQTPQSDRSMSREQRNSVEQVLLSIHFIYISLSNSTTCSIV